ncbi:hypothetical protein EYC84_007222 [Monilinia fructicola]|uniref:Uncharacterized protein n=1 Tax=Monilinia fructicola TaxID=38448 RepID=A0A5M9K5Y0_MONFR|nr:hypothetical protein EYC84_007222 [Monilinia fructicola]
MTLESYGKGMGFQKGSAANSIDRTCTHHDVYDKCSSSYFKASRRKSNTTTTTLLSGTQKFFTAADIKKYNPYAVQCTTIQSLPCNTIPTSDNLLSPLREEV